MKILIVANDPHDIGGVMNYTRPLAVEFNRKEHDVYYLYSGAWNRKYDWFIRPYLRIQNKEFPFECAEVINSPNWAQNFGSPLKDISSPTVEKLFNRYLEKVKPDVMHVHSRIGLPTSIIRITARKGIQVFTTIHAYGMLCQRSVMVDYRGEPCEGPYDLRHCAVCTGHLKINIAKLKFAARVAGTSTRVLELLVKIKRKLGAEEKGWTNHQPTTEDRELEAGLRKRLGYNINLMNTCVRKNLCVSSDVKQTLMRYGVKEDKLLVQHIGSVIAEGQAPGNKGLHNPIVIGNIGGVGYYKGIHVFVEAVSKLQREDFVVKVFGKYERDYLESMMKDKKDLPITFYGRYAHEDLPSILEEIDVMVLPSICNDAAPQTIFESYSGGIPIIASRIGGFPDFIQDGVNGYLFEPGNSDDLADKLNRCLDSPKLLEEFRKKIPRLKTLTENASELLSLYEKV